MTSVYVVGMHTPSYCENCYQLLICRNSQLQLELLKQKKYYKDKINELLSNIKETILSDSTDYKFKVDGILYRIVRFEEEIKSDESND